MKFTYIYIYIYSTHIHILDKNKLVKLATVVKTKFNAPFTLVTTLRCRGGCYSYPWMAPLTLDPCLIMVSAKQRGIKYQFLSIWYDSAWDWT